MLAWIWFWGKQITLLGHQIVKFMSGTVPAKTARRMVTFGLRGEWSNLYDWTVFRLKTRVKNHCFNIKHKQILIWKCQDCFLKTKNFIDNQIFDVWSLNVFRVFFGSKNCILSLLKNIIYEIPTWHKSLYRTVRINSY